MKIGVSMIIKNDDGTRTLKPEIEGMHNAMRSFFKRRFNVIVNDCKVVFKTNEEAKKCYKYVTEESLHTKWGYKFNIDNNVVSYKIVELQEVTYIDELDRDSDYVKHTEERYDY